MRIATILKSLALAGCLALSAPLGASAAGPFEGPEFEQALRKWIEANPDVVLRSINAYVAKEKEREAQVADDIVLKLESELADPGKWTPVLGSLSGSVVLVEVIDANCVFCRRMEDDIARLIAKNPDLKVVRRYVPFLSPSSDYAARMATMVWKRHQGRYGEFDRLLMGQKQSLTTESIDRIATTVIGHDAMLALKSEISSGTTRAELDGVIASGLELTHRGKINGTPFVMVVGAGREGLFRGAVSADRIQIAIDKARGTPAK